MLQLPEPQRAQRQNVENWVLGNKPLVRSESGCFLNMSNDTDYVALGVAQRSDRSGLETLAELALRTFPSVRRLVCVPRTAGFKQKC
jgi:arginine deiminase